MQQLVKTTIADLLKDGATGNTEVYVMKECCGAENGRKGVYMYYMSVLSKMFEVGVDELLGRSRRDTLCILRTMAWTRLVDIDGWTFEQVAEYASRTHSVVVQLTHKFKNTMLFMPIYAKMFNAFNNAVNNNKSVDLISPFSYSFQGIVKK